MPKPFRPISIETFAELLSHPSFRRRIDAVHMHHTFQPNHSSYRGLASIEAMFNFHTGPERRWDDIAQHISIGPEGVIWTGRDWNAPPASSPGANGTFERGPFMFEIIGDFDQGRDLLAGAQRDTVLQVIALVQAKFGLGPETLRFHNQLGSPKTCPGSAIPYDDFVAEVAETHERLRGSEMLRVAGGAHSQRTEEIATSLFAGTARALTQSQIETAEHTISWFEERYYADPANAVEPVPSSTRAAAGISFGQYITLKPHIINLTQGRLSDSGDYQTSPEDLDAIFSRYIPEWLAGDTGQQPKKLVIFAHGGLVKEADGLAIAHKHVRWWLSNGVYPIYFVWETGLGEIIGQLIRGVRERAAARDIFDYTTDPIIQEAVRVGGGVLIWGGMKSSAELAAAPDTGGAWLAVQKLKALCDAHPGRLELHAAGHSAGSIFHSHLLPLWLGLPGALPIKTLHFLAPAIRVDGFLERLAPLVGDGIEHLSVFTMQRDWERNDHCVQIYRKSLLYLIYHGLESHRETPILGLEDSLRADPRLRAIFGLDAGRGPDAEVIWSVSTAASGRYATRSESHGGFDDDPATMNSVVRRILDVPDSTPIHEYRGVDRGRGVDIWGDGPAAQASSAVSSPAAPPERDKNVPTAKEPATKLAPADSAGKRYKQRALCVGINYVGSRYELRGCIADAELWARTLQAKGFEVTLLKEEKANLQELRRHLTALVESGQPGDTLVFQYAGHGSRVPDADHDEKDDSLDEAFCPYDFETGAFLIDDEVARITDRLKDGVKFRMFTDCCHSGDIARAALVGSGAAPDMTADERVRFAQIDAEIAKRYLALRQSEIARSGAPPPADERGMKAVLFAACQDYQVALESNGQGEYTRRAIPILAGDIAGWTNTRFHNAVVQAFGSRPRQNPNLWPDSAHSQSLFD